MTSPPRRRPGRPKQEGLVEQRREQIVEAAYHVFAESGFQTTTVSAIAKRAGVGQGTVYRYFGSKIEILREVFDYTAQKMFAALNLTELSVPFDSFEELTERIAHWGKALSELVVREPELLRILVVEANAADPELQERVVGIERIFAGATSTAIGKAVERGLVRPGVNANAYGHLLPALVIPGLADAYRGHLTTERREQHAMVATALIERALRHPAAAS